MIKKIAILVLTLIFLLTSCSYVPKEKQKFSLAMKTLTVDDDFIFASPSDIRIIRVEGIITSGSVTAVLQTCNSSGASCTNITSSLLFDGGRDIYTSQITSPEVSASQTIKWDTTSVSSPGYLYVEIYYVLL
jgi:PBP1b-binding outer membrane lipoprotein LpoB